jgi:hypothetical protein
MESSIANIEQIANLQNQIAICQNKINKTLERIGTDPTIMLLCSRSFIELQEELKKIEIFNCFIKSKSNFEEELGDLLKEILRENGHGSNDPVQNAIAYYQMMGKKAAYYYLSSKEFLQNLKIDAK